MIYKIKFVKGSDNMAEKISEYYVLYCYDNGTYMSSFNYWTEEISKAIKFKTKEYAEKSKEKYSNDVKIVKVKVSYLIEVMD